MLGIEQLCINSTPRAACRRFAAAPLFAGRRNEAASIDRRASRSRITRSAWTSSTARPGARSSSASSRWRGHEFNAATEYYVRLDMHGPPGTEASTCSSLRPRRDHGRALQRRHWRRVEFFDVGRDPGRTKTRSRERAGAPEQMREFRIGARRPTSALVTFRADFVGPQLSKSRAACSCACADDRRCADHRAPAAACERVNREARPRCRARVRHDDGRGEQLPTERDGEAHRGWATRHCCVRSSAASRCAPG